jgi:hypothetical protein
MEKNFSMELHILKFIYLFLNKSNQTIHEGQRKFQQGSITESII